MKDPRHKLTAKGRCRRCGLNKSFGKYCPVGFWASRIQHRILNGSSTEELNRHERRWLGEWEAKQAPSVAQERK